MAARVHRDHLEVRKQRAPEVVQDAAPEVVQPANPGDIPYVEPDEYGLRVNWQSEAVRIEAAEFLLATRVQEDSRRRLARLVMRLREQVRSERKG
jgi:hypothetical protein